MSAPFVPPARVVFDKDDRERILELIDGALQSGNLTIGPLTSQLEERFAETHRAQHAVGTNSGTSAIEIALRGSRIEGAEVVVPANTFFATAAAVIHAGARPRFADIDPSTLALSAETLEKALGPSVVAVIHVHIGGFISPEMDDIRQLCDDRGVVLFEDAAHAHGSTFEGRPAGSWSKAATFSFYPTKVVASAEGGMILTDDLDLRDEARVFRDQGKASFLGGGHVRMGSAWRMSELQAAVALVQLSRMPEHVARRREVAAEYDGALKELEGIALISEPSGALGNYYKYIAVLDPGIDRDLFKSTIKGRFAVGMSGEVYATPLHKEPVFASLAETELPVAEDLCARHVCLPVHSDMADSEVQQVIDGVRGTLKEIRR
ncbi:MAG TPA: DegT/DnrJ/EryC1/StrS aminotransferase family protein [Acidimicrobiales bacterium]|nr:DegT/DnrJ/EryC1/StrS aminotransferase family protein [Acidimicrobiales bacterium]